MLEDEEKREIISCLENDLPLPEKYRFRLFAENPNPELIWSGKSRDPHLAEKAAFRTVEYFGGDNKIWQNRLFRADNAQVLGLLASGPMREEIASQGGIRLIYIDPPFNVNADFSMTHEVGAGQNKRLVAQKAYRDKWDMGLTGFLNMIYGRLLLMRDLLATDGSIHVHCDWRLVAPMRLALDEIFTRHVNEIVWHYTGGGRSAKHFSRKHDTILVYSKSGRFIFNKDAVRVPYKKTSGYARSGIVAESGKKYLPNPLGTIPDDVWDIPIINPMSRERCAYPTQKPEALLERIILAFSSEGDLVADFFCGSGTSAVVAERLGRKWLAVDSGKAAIHCARKRILQTRKELARAGRACPAFEILAADATDSTDDLEATDATIAPNVIIAKDTTLSTDTTVATDTSVGGDVQNAPDAERLADQQNAGRLDLLPHWQGNSLALEIKYFASPEDLALQKRINPASARVACAEISKDLPWQTLLDYWAIDYGCQNDQTPPGFRPKIFTSDWQTWRKDGEIALISPRRKMPPGKHKIGALAIDIFGNETRAEIAVETPVSAI